MSLPKKSFNITYRHRANMDLTVATSQLCKLSNAIDEIYNQNASALSFEELHRTAYNLVLQKHGDFLYDGISKAIKTHLTQSSIEISQCSSDNLISLTVSKWLYHRTAFTLIKDVLMYMDRSYVKINKKLPVYENSLQLFKNIIILHPLIRDRLKKSVVSEINNERLGIIIDRNAIKNVLSMYCDLGNDGYNFYEVEFEQYFLEMSKEFYISESLDYLTNNNLSDYLKKAELRINEEITRANTYLSISSLSSIRLSTEYCFLITHYKVILDIDTTNGLLIMLNENKLDDLHRLYKLSYRINICLEQLREVISSYMKMKLTEIFNNNEEHKDSIKFVQLIINLKNKFDNLIVNAFDNDKVIQKLQKDCFELILNKDTRFALHLSCYLDNLLKSGFNSASEQYIDIELDNIIIIFKFLLDKDIFEDYYKKSLAKRLLSNKTVSDEAEKLVISKFKAECGYQFTNKMEGMFVDINNSKVIMDEFRSSNLYHQLEVEVELKTLSNGFWPFPTQTEFHLPVQLTNSYEKFKEFYMSNTNRSMRKLSLMSNMGSVDMKAYFIGDKRFDLGVSVYQACILMLYNSTDTMKFSSIVTACKGIPDIELRRHLLSLTTPKCRLLKKSSKGKGIEMDDDFTINEEFTSKLKRIKVPLVSTKDVIVNEEGKGPNVVAGNTSGAGGSDVPSSVEEERRHLVQATVVRVMKARKRMSHNDLVAEVTRQLTHRFQVSLPFLKKRVEELIEREYIARDKDDPRMYSYLA